MTTSTPTLYDGRTPMALVANINAAAYELGDPENTAKATDPEAVAQALDNVNAAVAALRAAFGIAPST